MATSNLVTPVQKHVDLLTRQLEAEAYSIDVSWLLPQDLEPLANYAFVCREQIDTGRGVHWVGLVYCDGVPVFEVENRGDGGCNWYYDIATGFGSGEAIENFKAACRIAFPDDYEAQDTAITFLDAVNEMGPQE